LQRLHAFGRRACGLHFDLELCQRRGLGLVVLRMIVHPEHPLPFRLVDQLQGLVTQRRVVDGPAPALQVRLGDPRREAVDDFGQHRIGSRVGRLCRRRRSLGHAPGAAARRLPYRSGFLLVDHLDRRAQALGDVRPRLVAVRPGRHRPHVGRQSLQAEKRQRLAIVGIDVDGPDDDRHDRGVTRPVALHGDGQLVAEDVVALDEVLADEQQHQVGHLQLLVDLRVPVLARLDFAVVPRRQQPAPLEDLEVSAQLVTQRLVFVRVAVEQADRRRRGGILRHQPLNVFTRASQPLRSTTTSLPTAT
jgi:hypothetical protein